MSVPIYQNEHRVKLAGQSHWCGHCGSQLNGATMYGATEPVFPNEGDYTVCAYCGTCGRFRGDRIEPLTIRQMAEMDDDERDQLEKAGRALGFRRLKLRRDPSDPTA